MYSALWSKVRPATPKRETGREKKKRNERWVDGAWLMRGWSKMKTMLCTTMNTCSLCMVWNGIVLYAWCSSIYECMRCVYDDRATGPMGNGQYFKSFWQARWLFHLLKWTPGAGYITVPLHIPQTYTYAAHILIWWTKYEIEPMESPVYQKVVCDRGVSTSCKRYPRIRHTLCYFQRCQS